MNAILVDEEPGEVVASRWFQPTEASLTDTWEWAAEHLVAHMSRTGRLLEILFDWGDEQ